ncbi:MAG: DUF1697 domain-containing protein [Acidimicrobiales bacterium]
MTTFIALLRAVNVGGKNQVSMAKLRVALESLGYSGVTTYIQSGNIVLDGKERTAAAVAPKIEAVIALEFGLTIDVVMRTAKELTTAIDANPFLSRVPDRTKLHVAFLNHAPDHKRLETLDSARFVPDEFAVGGREVYLHCPEGLGRSKLAVALGTKLAPGPATVRNWNTVTKLAALVAAR